MSKQNARLYRARTLSEAFQQITSELGRDAVIIEKRVVKKRSGRFSGLLGGSDEMVEVLASSEPLPEKEKPKPKRNLLQQVYAPVVDEEEKAPPAAPAQKSSSSVIPSLSAQPGPVRSPALDGEGEKLRLTSGAKLSDIDSKLDDVLSEVRRCMLTQLRHGAPTVSDSLVGTYEELIENNVASEIAREMVEELQRRMPGAVDDPEAINSALCEAAANVITTAGEIKLRGDGPTVAVVVGPTGVGKTTTIVKLAFEFSFRRQKRVGLITEDINRPGAQEQLERLVQLLGLPVVAADSPQRATEALRQMSDCDLILVDTAGRAPRNDDAVLELSGFLDAIQPHEVHLVLSSQASQKSVDDCIVRFRRVGFDRIVFSKLDEAADYGLLLNVAWRVNEGISYVTTGQGHMQDIMPGEKSHLARLVLGMERIDPHGYRGQEASAVL